MLQHKSASLDERARPRCGIGFSYGEPARGNRGGHCDNQPLRCFHTAFSYVITAANVTGNRPSFFAVFSNLRQLSRRLLETVQKLDQLPTSRSNTLQKGTVPKYFGG